MMTVQLSIPHRLGKIDFRLKPKRKIPTSWQELKWRHFPALQTFYQDLRFEQINKNLVQGQLVADWLRLPSALSASPSIFAQQKLLEVTRFFTTTILHDQPMLDWAFVWSGPGQGLKHLNYEQGIYAEKCLEKWLKTENPDYRDAMVSLVFRCKWLPWSKRMATLRQHLLKLLPLGLRIKMAYTFIGQRNHLPRFYPELYDGRSETGPTLKPDQMILANAEGDISKYNTVRKAPYHLVLEKMHSTEINYRHQKRKSKQNGSN